MPPKKLKNLVRSFLILFALYFAYSVLITAFRHIWPSLANNDYRQEFINGLITNSPFRAFVTIVIVAPILEEMMFRSLIRPVHLDVILFISVWPMVAIVTFIPLDVNWMIKLAFTAVLLFSTCYILMLLIPYQKTFAVRRWLKKYKIAVLIISSLVFGFIHITNYVDGFMINLPLFLLIFPRILAGIMLGWIKLKNGFLPWSMALHALNNGFALLVMMLTFA